MSDNASFLQIENLSVAAGKEIYVKDASLSLSKGEFHGLLGPNGAGKSTLLRALYRSTEPASGQILLENCPISAWSRSQWARKVGALVQGTAMFAGLKVRDLLEIGIEQFEDKDARIIEAAELAGLSDMLDKASTNLSGGELQRCLFAQIIARQPELYLLDEPTNHLDLHYQLKLLDYVKNSGKTVIASLHDLSMAARFCDRVSLIFGGEIVATGSVEEVLTSANLQKYYQIDAQLFGKQLHIA